MSSSSSSSSSSSRNNIDHNRHLNPVYSAAAAAAADSFTYAANYGIVGDSKTDNTKALQAAIDDAASNDSIVFQEEAPTFFRKEPF